jgi:hypothetical protein
LALSMIHGGKKMVSIARSAKKLCHFCFSLHSAPFPLDSSPRRSAMHHASNNTAIRRCRCCPNYTTGSKGRCSFSGESEFWNHFHLPWIINSSFLCISNHMLSHKRTETAAGAGRSIASVTASYLVWEKMTSPCQRLV